MGQVTATAELRVTVSVWLRGYGWGQDEVKKSRQKCCEMKSRTPLFRITDYFDWITEPLF